MGSSSPPHPTACLLPSTGTTEAPLLTADCSATHAWRKGLRRCRGHLYSSDVPHVRGWLCASCQESAWSEPTRLSPATELDGLVKPLLIHGLLHLLCLKEKDKHRLKEEPGANTAATWLGGPVPGLPSSGHCQGQQSGSWLRPSRPYLAWPMVLPGHPRSSSAPGAPPGPWEWRLRPAWHPGPQPTPSLLSSRAGGNHGRRFFQEKPQGGPVSHSCALSPHPPLAAGPPKPVEPGRDPHTQPHSLSALTSHSLFQWPPLQPHRMSPHHLPEFTQWLRPPTPPPSHPCPKCLPQPPSLQGGSMATGSGKLSDFSLAPPSLRARPTLGTRSSPSPGLQASDTLRPAWGGWGAHPDGRDM